MLQGIRTIAANMLLEDAEIVANIEALFNDIQTYWLPTIRPERLSVSGDQHRTNNTVENFHGRLNRGFRIRRLTFLGWIGRITS